MKIVLLDGYAQGQVFTWRDVPPVWKIVKPINTIHINCEDCDFTQPEQIEYKRTFVSEDRDMALYSTTGKSETIVNSRDWIRPKERIVQAMPIYLMDVRLQSQKQKED